MRVDEMAFETRDRKIEPTTLAQMRDLAIHPPPAAQMLERLIENNPDKRFHPTSLVGAARSAIKGYREIINQPSEFDITYRRNLITTLNNLETRLNGLQKKPMGDPALKSWVNDYNDFKIQFKNLVRQDEKTESRVKTTVTVLGVLPDATIPTTLLTVVALELAPFLVPVVVIAGAAMGIAKQKIKPALEREWKARRESSRTLYADADNVVVAASSLKRLATGIALLTTGVELPEKKVKQA